MCDPGDKLVDSPELGKRPSSDVLNVSALLLENYGIKASGVKSMPSYFDINFYFSVVDHFTHNRHIQRFHEDGYVLKVFNDSLSSRTCLLKARMEFSEHVREQGIPTQETVLDNCGNLISQVTVNGTVYLVRVVTFVPGQVLMDIPKVPETVFNVGLFLGRLHNASEGFYRQQLENCKSFVNIDQISVYRNYFYLVQDQNDCELLENVVRTFESDVGPKLRHFAKGIIHNDVSDANVIVRELPSQDDLPKDERTYDVKCLIDFDVATFSYYVCDVAVTAAYSALVCPLELQLDLPGYIIAGYCHVRGLSDEELLVIQTLICTRLCFSIVCGLRSYSLAPWNKYTLRTIKPAFALLRKFWRAEKSTLLDRWKCIVKERSSR